LPAVYFGNSRRGRLLHYNGASVLSGSVRIMRVGEKVKVINTHIKNKPRAFAGVLEKIGRFRSGFVYGRVYNSDTGERYYFAITDVYPLNNNEKPQEKQQTAQGNMLF